jgi:hypothetical protein
MQDNGKPSSTSSDSTDWRQIAEKASEEADPKKLSELVKQLCDRLDEIEHQKKSAAASNVVRK